MNEINYTYMPGKKLTDYNIIFRKSFQHRLPLHNLVWNTNTNESEEILQRLMLQAIMTC